MRIRLIGQRNSLGIGTHYANFADALKRRAGVGHLVDEVDFLDREAFDRAVVSSQSDDINICFVAANIHDFFQGTNIQWIVFESTIIAENILSVLQEADQVWVPSVWGRKTLIDNGISVERIYIVPEGVNPDQYYAVGINKPDSRPTRFLFVGKYEDRKSCRELLEAWHQAWDNDPSVELIIKTNYFVDYPEKQEQLNQHIVDLGITNVQVIWGELSSDDMITLYRSCDIFVFPTKGEGWGLPLIEAAAMGLPLITTFYSAPRDFLQPISSSCLFVDYDIKPIDCPEFKKFYTSTNGSWGDWAHPRVDSLARRMRQAVDELAKLAQEAQKNSEIIRKDWNWTKSVDLALAAIRSTAQT